VSVLGYLVCEERIAVRGVAELVIAVVIAAAAALPNVTRPAVQAAQSGQDTSTAGSMSHGGIARTYRIHVPAPARRGPMPLVLALHGGGGDASAMLRLTLGNLNRAADREGFLVVYPDGVERHWNDGRGLQWYRAHRENVDDVGFLAALITNLPQRYPVDARRVYATGISNGGLMSFRLARELAGRIAAIAPVAASMSEPLMQMREPSRPISVLMIAGTKDPLVPWEGGEIGFANARQKNGRVISVPESAKYWATANHCALTPVTAIEPDRDPNDGTRVRRVSYSPCRDGTEVIVYAVEGGGHTWPGGQQYLPARFVGRTSRDIDANEVIWSFFKGHAVR
jgi:polyhydroxybutyrate depolymerase